MKIICVVLSLGCYFIALLMPLKTNDLIQLALCAIMLMLVALPLEDKE